MPMRLISAPGQVGRSCTIPLTMLPLCWTTHPSGCSLKVPPAAPGPSAAGELRRCYAALTLLPAQGPPNTNDHPRLGTLITRA